VTASIKVNAFLAYTMAVCVAIINKCDDPGDDTLNGNHGATVRWRTLKLLESCQEMAAKYKTTIDKSKLRQINKAYAKIDSHGWMDGKHHLETCLAFLMAGLDKTKTSGSVVKRLTWLLKAFDASLTRYNLYEIADREYKLFMEETQHEKI
jgi:hypothetical protein